MSIDDSRNAKIILRRVKSAFDLKRDGDLAKFLGIAQSTLSSWKVRNSLDYEALFAKCEKLNFNWLINGELPVWKKDIRIREGAAKHSFEIITDSGQVYTPENIAEKLKNSDIPDDEKMRLINQKIALIDAYIELQYQQSKKENKNDEK